MATIPKSRKLAMLQALFGEGTIMVDLYSNNVTVDENTKLADLHPVSVPGHTPQVLATGTITDADEVLTDTFADVVFRKTLVPFTTYGYFVYNATQGFLCWTGAFGGSAAGVPAGYYIKISPSLGLG